MDADGRGGRRHAARARRWGQSANNQVVHMPDVRHATHLVVGGALQIPKHDAAELRLVPVRLKQFGNHMRFNVTAASRAGGSGKTNKELGVRAGFVLQILDPSIVVEAFCGGITARVVVELDEKGIKLGVINEILQFEILGVQGALRGGRDEVVSVADQLAQLGNHGGITTGVGKVDLDVEIETIDRDVLVREIEGAGSGTVGVVGPERLPQELGEVLAIRRRRHLVVANSTSDG